MAEVESRIEKWAAGATKRTEAEMHARIVEHAFWLLKQGYRESTIKSRARLLRLLVKRGADLLDSESVKEVIAKQDCSENSKVQIVATYATFAEMMGITWEPPRYLLSRKLPFIPTEVEIDQLTAGCGKKTATLLQTLKETAMRIGEAWQLIWIDIDSVNNTIRVNSPEKNSNPRIIKVSSKLMAMLNELPKKSEKVFGYTWLDSFRRLFNIQRRKIAEKLQNPRILHISFHTLRHWKATMEYHRTKDILYVKNLLGHRKIDNTLIYTQLVNFDGDEYTSRVARTLKEACELVEVGFEYITEMDGAKIFRKRK